MRNLMMPVGLSLVATPAFAAGDVFFSLANTDFVVLLGFVLFLAVLVYFKVPELLGGMLDKRADGIRSDLDEARALRDEAQTLLASYERKQREVEDQVGRIVTQARAEAEEIARQAQVDMENTLARRLSAAEDQIASAQAAAVREVRDRAIVVAVSAAKDVVAQQMSKDAAAKLIDDAIGEVGAKLH